MNSGGLIFSGVGLTQSNLMVHSTHGKMCSLSKECRQMSGTPVAMCSPLQVRANEIAGEAGQQSRAVSRMVGMQCSVRHDLFRLSAQNGMARKGELVSGDHAATRQKWSRASSLFGLQRASRANAWRYILQASEGKKAVSGLSSFVVFFVLHYRPLGSMERSQYLLREMQK